MTISLADIDLSRLKFLVVDDSSMARNNIERLLKDMGARRVDKVEDGKEALLKIKKSVTEAIPYSLVTLDWEMPEMGGLELLKILKADPKLKDIPVLMISNRGAQESIKEIAAVHPIGYLVKPFTDDVFAQRIAAIYPRLK